MQPDSKQSHSGSTPAQQQDSNVDDDGKGKKPAVKKRTKTGCLSKSDYFLLTNHLPFSNSSNQIFSLSKEANQV